VIPIFKPEKVTN